MPEITAYRIHVEQAYEADVSRHYLSFDRWSGDTRDYQGWDEEVRVSIADGCTVAEGQMGDTLLFAPGERSGYTLADAMQADLARYIGEAG